MGHRISLRVKKHTVLSILFLKQRTVSPTPESIL